MSEAFIPPTALLEFLVSDSTQSTARTDVNSFSANDDLDSNVVEVSSVVTSSSSPLVPPSYESTTEGVILHPHQPRDVEFPSKLYGKVKRRFQGCFFDKHPWLHWNANEQAVYCHVCRNVHVLKLKLLTLSKHGDHAFSVTGYQSWKTPTLDFKKHENSEKHRECVQKWLQHVKGVDVDAQVCSQKRKEQQVYAKALQRIFESIMFLGRQGLSLRGHVEEEGNFWQILKLVAKDNSDLKTYLDSNSRRKFSSHANQNEILSSLSHAVLRKITTNVVTAKYYALIADETTDVARKQQMSISLRWIDSLFAIHEDFVGMYEVEKADAVHLSGMLLDAIKRFGLDISNIRGQGYDGASVMAGSQSGVAKRISDIESRALFVHCSGHCMSLAVQDAARSIALVRDTIEFVKDIVNFMRASPLRMRTFELIKRDTDSNSETSLRPLCPTRWTVRARSIQSVIDNYAALMQALDEVSQSSPDESSAKANGFLKRLECFDTYVGLRLSLPVLEQAEICNNILQSSAISLADAKRAASTAADMIRAMRNDDYYDSLYTNCEMKATELDLNPPVLPQIRRAPRRIDDGAHPVRFDSPKQMFRQSYVQLIDHAEAAIRSRFEQRGMELACQLEDIITRAATGMNYINVKKNYNQLKSQLRTTRSLFIKMTYKNRKYHLQL